MKVLFITAGIVPARGVSNYYQEALMEGMVARGHQVACLCTAGIHPRPGLSWACDQEEPYKRYTIFNAGVYAAPYSQGGVGSRRPLRDVQARPALRHAVMTIVQAERPDVVSIQSLFGLPFDGVGEIQKAGIPVVFTAHDYFALCPTAHLFLPQEQRCRLRADELVCRQCCERSPSYRAFWLSSQLDRLAAKNESRPLVRNGFWRLRNAVKQVDRRLIRSDGPNAYSERRRQAVEFLKRLDILHCISERQAAVFRELCGPLANIRVLHLIPPTIEQLRPVPRAPRAGGIVSFVALNVNGAYKGFKLMESAFKKLAITKSGYDLHVYGNSLPGPEIPRVTYHGRYKSTDLDRIAAQADFCLVPSVWDETLCFAGLEMLARGVPLIVSGRAGVSDFIRDGENGFIFDPSSPELLCAAIERALAPECRVQRHCQPAGVPAPIIFEKHLNEMAGLLSIKSPARQTPETVCK